MAIPTWVASATGDAIDVSASWSVPPPTGTTSGDVVVVLLATGGTVAVTPPTGFTLRETHEGISGTIYVFWKRESGSPPANYTFTFPGGAAPRYGVAFTVRGAVASGDPLDLHIPSRSAPEVVPPLTLVASAADSLVVWGAMIVEDATGSTAPTGFTNRLTASGYSFALASLASSSTGDIKTTGGSYSGPTTDPSVVMVAVLSTAPGTLPTDTDNTDWVIDWQAASAGTAMTTALLLDAQRGAAYPWDIQQKGGANTYTGMTFGTTPFGSAYMPSIVSGHKAIAAGSVAYRFSHVDSPGGDGGRLRLLAVPARTNPDTTVYALIKFGAVAPDASEINIDHIMVEIASGAYAVLQQQFSNSINRIRSHSSAGSTQFGSPIDITAGHLYWVALRADTTLGECEVRVYDAEAGNALVGTSESALSTGSYLYDVVIGGGYIEGSASGTTEYGPVIGRFATTGWPLVAGSGGSALTASLSDAIALGDSTARAMSMGRAMADTVSLGDSMDRAAAFTRALADAIALGDTFARAMSMSRASADAIALGDATARAMGMDREAADAIALGDSTSRAMGMERATADAIALGDSISQSAAFARALSDAIELSDSTAAAIVIVRALSDALELGDSVSRGLALSRVLTEALVLAEQLGGTQALARALTDAVSLDETLGRALAASRAVTDDITLADLLSGTVIPPDGELIVRALSDALELGDSTSASAVLVRALADAISLADSTTTAAVFVRLVSDGLSIADALSASSILVRALGDQIALTDQLWGYLGGLDVPALKGVIESLRLRASIADQRLRASIADQRLRGSIDAN